MYCSKRQNIQGRWILRRYKNDLSVSRLLLARCSLCYDELTVNSFNQYNMKYLRKRTTIIDEFLRAGGYNVVAIWEHEFDKNKEMKT